MDILPRDEALLEGLFDLSPPAQYLLKETRLGEALMISFQRLKDGAALMERIFAVTPELDLDSLRTRYTSYGSPDIISYPRGRPLLARFTSGVSFNNLRYIVVWDTHNSRDHGWQILVPTGDVSFPSDSRALSNRQLYPLVRLNDDGMEGVIGAAIILAMGSPYFSELVGDTLVEAFERLYSGPDTSKF